MKNRKNLILHIASLFVLCAGFVLIRYVFFDVHGMKEWPFNLFVYGVILLGISFFAKARQIPIFTALSYIGGFVVALLFQTDGIDPGGGKTNNLWIIWTGVFVCFTLVAIIIHLIGARKKKVTETEVRA